VVRRVDPGGVDELVTMAEMRPTVGTGRTRQFTQVDREVGEDVGALLARELL